MALEIQRKRFTTDEYHHMAQAGILGEDERVELISGEIIEMSPIGKRHAACVNRLNALLAELLRRQAIVSVQNPLQLGNDSEPEPDIALLRFREDYYAERLPGPGDTFLLIEVADTTLDYDRSVKLPEYARTGVPEVWIVNLVENVVEVYKAPTAGAYSETQLRGSGETVPVPGFADARLRVGDILG